MSFLLIPYVNIVLLSLVVAYIYISIPVKTTHWISILCINMILLIMLFETNSIIYFYLIFELINILTYSFISIQSYNIQNFKSNIIYFLVGFVGSLLFLYGLYFKMSLTSSSIFGDLMIVLALVLKVGAFPFPSWIVPVYKSLSNSSFLFLSVISKFNFLVVFICWVSLYSSNSITEYILIISAVGTSIIGGVILGNQVTVKGFLAISSLVSLPLWFVGFYVIIKDSVLHYEVMNGVLVILVIFVNVYIVTSTIGFILWMAMRSPRFNKLQTSNKNFLQSLYFWLLPFKDLYIVVAFWILGGFPPFILFILKFYLLYYGIITGSIQFIFLILFVLSSLVLFGYSKVITSIMVKLKYTI